MTWLRRNAYSAGWFSKVMNTSNSSPTLISGSSPSFHESVNLDFLRSIAVLLVFGTHYYDIRNDAGAKWSFPWHLGQLGVLIFFVHTSLVLMWSLERASLKGWQLFVSFYVR